LRITAEELNKTLGGSRVAARIGALDLETHLDDMPASAAAGDATGDDEGGDD